MFKYLQIAVTALSLTACGRLPLTIMNPYECLLKSTRLTPERRQRFLLLQLIIWFAVIPSCTSNRHERDRAMQRMRGKLGALHVHVAAITFPHKFAFPPAVLRDKDGKALSSWRFEMAYGNSEPPPYLNQPWNSSSNQQFASRNNSFLVKDLDAPSIYTQVFALVGPDTAYSEYEQGMGRDLIDCEPDAILLLEAQNQSINWMEPGDVELDDLTAGDWQSGIGNLKPNYPDAFIVGFVDGSVWLIDKNVPRAAISKFFTLKEAARYDRDEVLGPYTFKKTPPLPKLNGRYTLPKKTG
jgi:hypothetical protein